ncbi:MAG TPA: hypothetical protein VK498_06440 [Ferruginibacter sp.]|nr:hypothetical protein [Ferruginibacter sp.]
MEENTEGDQPIENPEASPGEDVFAGKTNIPETEEELSTLNLKPLDPAMETHAHHLHHAPGKKFWHYFYEFLMLFLAVFCGFIAENFREHYVEGQRANELAKNLYKEIIADSVAVQQCIAKRTIKESECAYFISYVKDSSLTEPGAHFYPAFSWALIQTQRIIFEPNDGILNQLRNSGELRYFKSPELQAAIGKLSVMITNIRARNGNEYSFVENNIRPFSLRFYDFTWYEDFTNHGKLELYEALVQKTTAAVQGKIPNLDKFDRKEAENITNYYLLMLRATRMSQYTGYARINHELLEVLRKEYHLE